MLLKGFRPPCGVRSAVACRSETETSYTFIICKTAGKSILCEIGMGNDPAALQVSEQGVCARRGGVGRGVCVGRGRLCRAGWYLGVVC